MIQFWVFFGGSACLAAISWKSLKNPRSHGFHRFFAWECILGLLLLNVEFWFYKPFAWNQIIAWTLLLASLIPLIFGIQTLKSHGEPVEKRAGDDSLLAFEKTSRLVTSGIYKYIRHPLYSSLFLLTWGIFFKSPSSDSLTLAELAAFCLFLTAKADEDECVQFFGPAYQKYMQKTKMFIPYVL